MKLYLRLVSFGLFLTLGLPFAEAGQGGGYTLAGLVGEYHANPTLAGNPAFIRREVRLDFGLNDLPPGGAGRVGDLAFRSVPAAGFSVRWSGQLIPRFSEAYTFKAFAKDGFQLRLRAAGGGAWSTVIDQASHTGAESTGAQTLVAGTPYDVEATLTHGDGPWAARLRWSSRSTPDEVIDPLVQSGINNPEWSSGFTDIVKGARNSWEGVNGGAKPAMDADGWPMGDGAFVFQESLNQGLDLDPLMRGRISFSFRGSATVSLQGNVRNGSLTSQYDAAQNLTTGSFIATNTGWNASFFRFSNARRNGQPGGPPGLTELRLMRPTAPDANTSGDPDTSLFTPQLRDAMGHFTVIRHQYVANQQRDWSERTPPAYFNQRGGTVTAAHYGVGDPSENGASWEHKILLANETGRDLMLSLPTVASGRTAADTASYVWKLANLLRYGSDGVEPYLEPVADPVYPPLNPNLRVYLELENELWNWASVFYVDWANVNALTAADADANNTDFQAINFDGLSTAKDGSGNYVSMNTWRFRKIMLRMIQISDIFRAVWGEAAMMSRVRPLYEWQYANDNDTARLALTFADRYFNNGDGESHVPNPRPVSHWLWGGGGATYYGAVNGNGLTTLLPDPAFATPVLAQPGYQPNPGGGAWSFTGTAGIARDAGAADDIPPAFIGSQAGYLTDHGSASITVTFPATFTSPIFAVSFKAVNRIPSGSTTADRQNLRVYLDGTTDLTARTFSQGNGYTPPGYDAGHPWAANNVFWTWSEYYFTRSFSVQPGSTHTITFRGQGDPAHPAATGQTVFLGEVRITSVDRIFADGMPGGGEATGQPVGQNIQRTMNVEAAWAKAFGLEQLSYESGWSLGGDDGGSWVQLMAKYGDARTAGVQARFMDMFHLAGSAVNVFGTYAQWPSWGDYYAEQGLLNVGRYPIVQGIDDRASHLPAEASQGALAPVVLVPALATLTDHADVLGRITAAGGWIHWNVIVPRAGPYDLVLTPAGAGGRAVLLVDDQPVADTGAPSGSLFLTRGLHSVKVRSTSAAAFQVQQITLGGQGSPASPVLRSVADGDAQATVSWEPVDGATEYQVRVGTAPGVYTQVIEVGNATAWTIGGLTNNQQYYFAVLAGNPAGLSLPSVERGVIPLGPGQPGSLAVWEFTGAAGNAPAVNAGSASSRLVVGALHRGPGLEPSASEWAAGMRVNRFASEPSASAGHAYGTDLAQAITKKQYYEFTLEPVPGQTVSLQQLTFRAFFQNGTGGAGLTWSTNGSAFSSGLLAAPPANGQSPWTVDLSGVPELQRLERPVTLRVLLFGAGAYQVTALGDASGPDLVLTGSLDRLGVPLRIGLSDPENLLLQWPTNAGLLQVEASTTPDAARPWTPVTGERQLAGNDWVLPVPRDAANRFFLLTR